MKRFTVEYRAKAFEKGHPEDAVQTEFTTRTVVDPDGSKLKAAQEEFIAGIIDEVKYMLDEDIGTVPENDVLLEEVWFEEATGSEVERFSVLESDVIAYVEKETRGYSAIIDGRRCCTATAQFIGEAVLPGDYKDVIKARERLYRKRTGEFFMETLRYMAEGMPVRSLAHTSIEYAKDWVKTHAYLRYEGLFGKIEENAEKVLVTYTLRKDTKAMLEQLKNSTGRAVGDILDEAVSKFYAEINSNDKRN